MIHIFCIDIFVLKWLKNIIFRMSSIKIPNQLGSAMGGYNDPICGA
jgi:hypothetical protein